MMASHQPRSPRTPRKFASLARLFYRWHRRIGATAAVFLIWIVVSGWLLNHSEHFNLAQRFVHNATLAHWYNLDYQKPSTVFTNQQHWIVSANDILLIDGKPAATPLNNVIGFTQSSAILAIANNHDIILLDEKGQLIDKLNEQSLPIKNITKTGNGCAGIAVSDDKNIFSTSDGINWDKCNQAVSWSTPTPINSAQLAQSESFLIPAISVEKIIVDLHTGRFFGQFGAYVVDTIGLCLLLLALSGLWLFLRAGRKNK